MAGKPIDRTDQEYGLLTVIERAPDRDGSGHAYWLCRCACGRTVEVRSSKLAAATACGCLKAAPETRRAARLKTAPAKRKRIARAGGLARWARDRV